MKKLFLFSAIVLTVISFSSCSKSSEDFQTSAISDYNPLAVGKYITYRLDSSIYTNFGTTLEIHSYEVKHAIESQITDNLGRPAYRVVRYIRNSPADAWISDNTFMAVNTTNEFEFVENNMRFLKLKMPIRNNFSWKGNSYIDTYSLNSEVIYLDDWDYMYDSVNVQQQVGTYTLDNCLVVNQRDEVINDPSDPNIYSEINFGQEKYASGIGMVYRRFYHSEYQPPVPGLGGHFVTGSYGVELTMIDHN